MKTALSTVLLATLAATATAQSRGTAEASFSEGKVEISYGVPKWQAGFEKAMASRPTWRLGAGNPTRVKLTCALMTDSGCVPAGEYGMAMHKDAGKWNLVVYSGDGFYNAERGGWMIAPAKSKSDAEVADNLELAISKDKKLEVRFGPHMSVFDLQPVKMHPLVKTEFARMPTTVEVMALPTQGMKAGSHVGTASVERDGMKVSWNLALTIDGDSATLKFDNDRIKGIGNERRGLESRMKRIMQALENNENDRMKQMLADTKASIEKLDDEAAALERFKTSYDVTGSVAKRDEAASVLAFESMRIDGGIVLTFGAGDKTATFSVKPRNFLQRRR